MIAAPGSDAVRGGARIATEQVDLVLGPGAPQVRLLDARSGGLGEMGLRELARSQPAAAGGTHVSRSYRYPYAVIAWHGASVGIDIERIECFVPGFASSICTPSETIDWSAIEAPDDHLASMWCSKEALSKALGDALRYDPRRLESPILWPGGRAGPWRAQRLAAPARHVVWICWRSQVQPA